MLIDVITLFPAMFEGPLTESMVKRARAKKIVEIRIHNLRDYAQDKHRTTDDRPFGGGPGMLMKPEPIFGAVEAVARKGSRVILLSPRGEKLSQKKLAELSRRKHLVFITGHYEGVDARVEDRLVDEEISIGDYVLTNGALPAMVVIDGLVRLLPGALGDDQSSAHESFSEGLLEYPQYTRPAEFRGMKVPSILHSGHHAEIEAWRKEQSRARTGKIRPDLLKKPPRKKPK
jgi:tRNA (guanine37-N1)-methyltransferase